MKKTALLLSTALLLAACNNDDKPTPKPTPQPNTEATTFTLAILPDTQKYSERKPEIFEAQTDWIAKNAKSADIAMTLHLGDVVEHWYEQSEWEAADKAMKTLEATKMPYSVLAGNHDVWEPNDKDMQWDDRRGDSSFLRWFGKFRAEKQSTFVEIDPTHYNQAHVFEAGGNKFLVLALDWRASDATLAWADKVLEKYPTLPTILTTHQLLNIGPDFKTAEMTPNGERMWEGLIKDNDQIFLTLNGHHHGAANMVRQNAAGHDVQMMVVDYQSDYQGGNGYMRLLEFDLGANQMRTLSFSPWVTQKAAAELTQFDRAELTDPNNAVVWNINFAERFAGFNPDFKVPKQAADKSLLDTVRASYASFKPKEFAGTPATGKDDYPVLEGTLAHWRFDGTAGSVAGDITDISGNGNNLVKKVTGGADPNGAIFSADHSPVSAAGGSVCYNSEHRGKGEPALYWETVEGAPLNTETFEGGYTLETFIKISPDFNAKKNAWMGVITRDGDGHDIPEEAGYLEGSKDEPLAFLDISNLRELHWASASLATAVAGNNTNDYWASWSWSVPLDKWLHVAVVNDGTKMEMFVDGAPVLRNASTEYLLDGIYSAGKGWIIGAKHSGGVARNSFDGCIGEIRFVDHAINQSEFLSARKQ